MSMFIFSSNCYLYLNCYNVLSDVLFLLKYLLSQMKKFKKFRKNNISLTEKSIQHILLNTFPVDQSQTFLQTQVLSLC